jgi:multiple sugar transport system ATP-binding protein
VIVGVRPEDLEDSTLAVPELPRLHGTVKLCEALGSDVMAHFEIDARPAVTDEVRELASDLGTAELLDKDRGAQAVLVGRFGPRSRVRVGDAVDVAVDTRAFHFFDPDTGLGIHDDDSPMQ